MWYDVPVQGRDVQKSDCFRASPSYSCCIFPALDLCWDPTRKVHIRKTRNSWVWIGGLPSVLSSVENVPSSLFNFWRLILLIPAEQGFQQSTSTFNFPTECFQTSFSDDDQICSWNRNRKTMIAMASTNLPGLPAMTAADMSALCFIAQCRNVHLPGRVKGVSCLAWPGTCWQCSNSYILLLQWGQL